MKETQIFYVKITLERIASGDFFKRDFADNFIFFWSDEPTTKMMLDLLSKPREKTVFERFAQIVKEKIRASSTLNLERLFLFAFTVKIC